MIYFDFGNSDEPDERVSAIERLRRKMAECAILARLEDARSCGCQHPYAVISVGREPGRFSFTVNGVKTACCSVERCHLEQALEQPMAALPDARFMLG
jgi:hypothetical protein